MSQPKKQIVLVAGEASGDSHAAQFVREMQATYPDQYTFTAIGGQRLAAAGVNVLYDLAQFGVTGLTEVFRQLHHIRKAFRLIQTHLKTQPVDLLILVDYPGFNLRLAKYVKSVLQIPILYYIGPQLWAWKPSRMETIRKYIDHMAVILPFEEVLYQRAQVPCTFVGHPVLKTLQSLTQKAAKEELSLPMDKKIVGLLPGSRQNELAQHMPLLLQAAERLAAKFPHIHFVVPIAHTLSAAHIQPFLTAHPALPVTLIPAQTQQAMCASDAVVVASGTASLECALLHKPMCIIYRGSWLTGFVALKVMRVKYMGLCNLIVNRMWVPELLQADCTPDNIAAVIGTYLSNDLARKRFIKKLSQLNAMLTPKAIAEQLPHLVHRLCLSQTN